MLDLAIKDQLIALFSNLDSHIEIKLLRPEVEGIDQRVDQSQLESLLQDVASTSKNITVTSIKGDKSSFGFTIGRLHEPHNIEFVGFPTGHEFSTLVLAILNLDGKGKMPDQSLQDVIKNITINEVSITSYISLSCENCPDVVQALNLICILNPKMRHKIVEASHGENEMKNLGIQGVPSVVWNKKAIHVGRSNLSELITKIQAVTEPLSSGTQPHSSTEVYDVAIIGGGPAGVSAAIYSARKGLKTILVADRIGGQLNETKGIENFISSPYTEGQILCQQLSDHIRQYPATVLENRFVTKITEEESFQLHTQYGEMISAKQIIIATGAKWRRLNIEGEMEYLGRGVAFCPHCDGPFYKSKDVAVVGGGNSGVEAAIDLSQICKSVTLIEYADKLKADEVLVQKLKTLANVKILTNTKSKAVIGDGQKVTGLLVEERGQSMDHKVDVSGVFIQIGLQPNSDFVRDHVAINGIGEIVVDQKGRTSRPGIYASGDVAATPFKQIQIAMGDGAKVALAAFEDQMLHGQNKPAC
jgi:NADH-dependent peroxiredoxin subunit F